MGAGREIVSFAKFIMKILGLLLPEWDKNLNTNAAPDRPRLLNNEAQTVSLPWNISLGRNANPCETYIREDLLFAELFNNVAGWPFWKSSRWLEAILKRAVYVLEGSPKSSSWLIEN